jgi:hypothetical protein
MGEKKSQGFVDLWLTVISDITNLTSRNLILAIYRIIGKGALYGKK